MLFTLKLNGKEIMRLNIPVTNPEFNFTKEQERELGEKVKATIEDELCVEAM